MARTEEEVYRVLEGFGSPLAPPVGLVNCWSVLSSATQTAFVLPAATAGTAYDLLKASRGPVETGLVFSLIAQVALGLNLLHSLGLVHRDVKLSNILLWTAQPSQRSQASGNVSRDVQESFMGHGSFIARLADYGLVSIPSDNHSSRSPPCSPVKGKLLGSKPYWAPELVDESRHPDPARDLWALGIVAASLLSGLEPRALPALPWEVVGNGDGRRLVQRLCAPAPEARGTALDVLNADVLGNWVEPSLCAYAQTLRSRPNSAASASSSRLSSSGPSPNSSGVSSQASPSTPTKTPLKHTHSHKTALSSPSHQNQREHQHQASFTATTSSVSHVRRSLTFNDGGNEKKPSSSSSSSSSSRQLVTNNRDQVVEKPPKPPSPVVEIVELVSTAGLGPLKHKTAAGTRVEIREDGWVDVEFGTGSPKHVASIAPEGNKVSVTHGTTGTVLMYSCLSELPSVLIPLYNYAASFVSTVAATSPRITVLSSALSASIMASYPHSSLVFEVVLSGHLKSTHHLSRILISSQEVSEGEGGYVVSLTDDAGAVGEPRVLNEGFWTPPADDRAECPLPGFSHELWSHITALLSYMLEVEHAAVQRGLAFPLVIPFDSEAEKKSVAEPPLVRRRPSGSDYGETEPLNWRWIGRGWRIEVSGRGGRRELHFVFDDGRHAVIAPKEGGREGMLRVFDASGEDGTHRLVFFHSSWRICGGADSLLEGPGGAGEGNRGEDCEEDSGTLSSLLEPWRAQLMKAHI